jgi:hypothetical protein
MLITTRNGESFDTENDLTAAERHVLQKLLLWEPMASSVDEFRTKKAEALSRGWNQSGPVCESRALSAIIDDLEIKVASRLKDG